MLFLFKEKPVEITAFVHEDFYYVTQYNPVRKASEFIPDWYKKMPHSRVHWGVNGYKPDTNTAKACVGIIGAFQNGLILPMWCDLAFNIAQNNIRWQFSDNQSNLEIHPNNQLPNFFPDHLFCKLFSPWVLKCNQNIKLVLTEPSFFINEKKEYVIPSAINTAINKSFGSNIFLFIKNATHSFNIQQGTPLLHLIPMTEKPVKLKIEVTTKSNFYNIEPGLRRISFLKDGLKKLKFHRNQKD